MISRQISPLMLRPTGSILALLTVGAVGLFAAETQGSAGDPIARVQRLLDRGAVELTFDARWGYLPSLLETLNIPTSSQVLVFSKTSAQFRRISPRAPRAIYFNDDVYVGWVQGGPFVEISAADPNGGGVFYTLDQRRVENPRFAKNAGECSQCHESGRTLRIPGHLTRSVYPDSGGTPFFELGTIDVDHTTDISSRFGGWYVTGTVGRLTHRGNATVDEPSQFLHLETGPASAVTDLSGRFDVKRYLTPHSDIVAHLVLGHQTQMHNYIALANIEARKALAYRKEMIRLFGESSEDLEASVRRRIEGPSEKLLRHLLFVDEAPLRGRVRGTTSFAVDFQKPGPRDAEGRSLRDLDLNRRLFRYPCSFLIYSESFQALPERVREYVFARLDEVLSGRDRSRDFALLSDEDRGAIREILIETLPEAKQHWAGGEGAVTTAEP